jgi:hypothetical protein
MPCLKILSLCTSAGLWDRALIEQGHTIVPGCEIMKHKRQMYTAFCGGEHLTANIEDLPSLVKGEYFDGVVGGIPCQSRSKLRAIRKPKFGDLLPSVLDVLESCTWRFFLFENVAPLDIPEAKKVRLNAMNFGRPHQSRPRWFTYSGLVEPTPVYPGSTDDLKAYPVVAGRIYGPKRGAWLQGWPEFCNLPFRCPRLQEALADGVPRCLADAWTLCQN